jgi:hypothetical protein
LSKKVLGFSEISAIVFLGSVDAFEGAGTKGLEIRDLVGLGVGVAMLRLHLPFFATASPPAGFNESGEALV